MWKTDWRGTNGKEMRGVRRLLLSLEIIGTNPRAVTMGSQNERYKTLYSFTAINGKLYANLKGLTMYKGERVTWYMLAMGQDIDLHTVHFHAESFLYRVS